MSKYSLGTIRKKAYKVGYRVRKGFQHYLYNNAVVKDVFFLDGDLIPYNEFVLNFRYNFKNADYDVHSQRFWLLTGNFLTYIVYYC